MITDKLRIHRYCKEGNSLVEIEDILLIEERVELYLNGTWIHEFICTKVNLEELTVGYIFGKGYISNYDEIESIEVEEHIIRVRLKRKINSDLIEIPNKNSMKGDPLEKAIIKSKCKEESKVEGLNYAKVFDVYSEFSKQSKLFQETGGVHSAKLVDKDFNDMFFAEDMGRHNAIDKVIGYGLKENISFEDKLIVVSSRMPLELVEKCHRVGITSIVSVSVVTENAARYGQKNNMDIIGMFRKSRFNVYSRKI